MEGMLFAVTGWTRGMTSSNNQSSFRVPCACVLEAISLSTANVNAGVIVIYALDEIFWSGNLPSSGTVTWLDQSDWHAFWTNRHGSTVRLRAGQLVSWQIDDEGVAPADLMVVMYFREG